MELCELLLIISCMSIRYLNAYDYGEDTPCDASPDQPSLACQRYTSCTTCSDTTVNCYCDSACRHYGDCCADAEVGGSPINGVFSDEMITCEQKVMNSRRVNLKIIRKCPSDYDGLHQSRCEVQASPSDLLVQGSVSGLIYANKDCAECHGEHNSNYLPFKITCTPTEPLFESYAVILHQLLTTGAYNGGDNVACELDFIALNGGATTYRHCIPGVVYTCREFAEQTDIEKCQSEPVSFVYEESDSVTKDPPYRNEWCARCNHIQQNSYNCKPPERTGGGEIRGFSSLVNANALSCVKDRISNSDSLSKVSDECDEGRITCPAGQVYKPLQSCQSDGTQVEQPCKIWVNSSNYEILEGKAVLKDSNETGSDYKLEGDQIFLCLIRLPSALRTSDMWPVPNSTLSVVLMALSISCIIGQLVLYCVFKALRNIPGLILICLCGSLLLAQSLFLVTVILEAVGEVSTTLCVAMAICQHYAFLAMFFWTNVMAFDVAQMLNTMTMKSHDKIKFLWYSLYAWLCPLVMITAALVAEYSEGKITPSYGARSCWISTKYGLIIYFLGPVFLIILVNIILYTISIASIIRAARQTKMVNPDLKERLYLAIKLIVVMGLPWIAAAFAAFIDHIALQYIFTILNATQGMQIFICYVFSKTVLNLFRKRGDLSRSRRSSNRTSTFSVSHRNSGNSYNSKFIRQISNTSTSIMEDKPNQQNEKENGQEQPLQNESSRERRIRRENSREKYITKRDSVKQPITSQSSEEPIISSERDKTFTQRAATGAQCDIATSSQQTIEPNKPKTLVGRTTTV